MKTRIAALLVIPLAFAACGGSDLETAAQDEPTTTTTEPAPETTTSTAAPETTTSTAAPETTTTTIAETTTTTEKVLTEDELAITEAYAVAFNSESTFEQTAPYLVEPDGLEETVAGYQSTGTSMGGVSVEIDSIEITGDEAVVKYTLLFGGNPTYSDLTGSAIRTDAGWQISRDMFCGLMTSARVGCPDQ